MHTHPGAYPSISLQSLSIGACRMSIPMVLLLKHIPILQCFSGGRDGAIFVWDLRIPGRPSGQVQVRGAHARIEVCTYFKWHTSCPLELRGHN